MFWATVYHGNSAYSWKTTARSQPGSAISAPPTRSSPRVGRSKPARRLSSVVLPHPLGPTMEKNSLFSTWKLTSCSARTCSPLIETCTLLTSLTLTCAMLLARSTHECVSHVLRTPHPVPLPLGGRGYRIG